MAQQLTVVESKPLPLTVVDDDDPASPSLDPLSDERRKNAQAVARGAAKGVGQTVVGAAKAVTAVPGVGRIIDLINKRLYGESTDTNAALAQASEELKPKGTAERVGSFAEQTAEFFVGGAAAEKTASTIAGKVLPRTIGPLTRTASGVQTAVEVGTNAAAQAATAAGQTKLQGQEGAVEAGAVAGAFPVAGGLLGRLPQTMRTAAQAKLSKYFQTAKQTGERMVSARIERLSNEAARDTLDSAMQWTWKSWQQANGTARRAAGETLEMALDGPLGQQMVDAKLFDDAIEGVQDETAKHMLYPSSQQGGGAMLKTYNDPKFDALQVLRDAIKEEADIQGGQISVKQLHDFKRMWQAGVWPTQKAGAAPAESVKELTTTLKKEASELGAAAIRQIFDAEAPTAAALDRAAAHAINLDKMVQTLATKAELPLPAKLTLRGAAGMTGLATVGTAMTNMGAGYHGYYLGAMLGYGAAQMVESAIQSPAWRTASPFMKDRLARAIANQNSVQVRRILAPIVTKSTTSAPPPKDDALSVVP